MLELAKPADREAVNALAEQVHRLHVGWRPDLFRMPEQMYTEEQFLEAIEKKELFCAWQDGRMVGYINAHVAEYDYPSVVSRREYVIEELGVREDCRGQGIGTQIMREAAALAKAFGCTCLRLGAYAENEDGLAFYRKMGFRLRTVNLEMRL